MVPYKPPHYHREARIRITPAPHQHPHIPYFLLPPMADIVTTPPPPRLPPPLPISPPTSPPPFNSTTSPPPAYAAAPPFRTPFATLVLHKADRIRLLGFPADDVAALRTVIGRCWPAGIQDERTSSAAQAAIPGQAPRMEQQHEFKCRGRPWTGSGATQVAGLLFMRAILAALYARGWVLSVAPRVGGVGGGQGQTVMVFRKEERLGFGVVGDEREWMALGFDLAGERVRMVGGMEEDVVAGIEDVLKALGVWKEGGGWKGGSQQRENSDGDGVYEIRVLGGLGKVAAGASGDEAGVLIQVLVVRLLEALEAGGWSLYASVDQNGGSHGKLSSGGAGMDSWYCVRAVDWVSGNTVYHR